MQNTNQSWEEVLCRPWGFEQTGTAKEGSFSRFYSRSKTWLCDRRQNTRGRNENVCLLFLSFFCSQVDKLAKCPSLSFWNVLNEQSKFLVAPKKHPSWKNSCTTAAAAEQNLNASDKELYQIAQRKWAIWLRTEKRLLDWRWRQRKL